LSERKTVLGLQNLVKMLHGEVPVPRPILLHHKLDPIHRRPPPRGSLAPPVDQALRTLRIVPVAQPTEMPHANP
jgi:hypothetical protein